MSIHDVLRSLLDGQSLTDDETEAVFEDIFAGNLDEAQIAGFLSLVQARGVTVDELVGAARAMRRHVLRVPAPITAGLIDTCGTGGAPKTFNVSTAVAFVAAGADPPNGRPRARVAKHGNRSRTGRGSAEVLELLGVNVNASVEVQARCLEEAGACFCFAIHHHPATKHAIGPRKSLGFPTMFNVLGPLTNPAAAPRQLIGIYDRTLVAKMGHTLARLGAERAMVVHGFDGLDEITTTDKTHIAHVEAGQVRLEDLDPAELGYERVALEQLQVTTLEDAAQVIRDVLDGKPGPKRDIVELNAAAALTVAGTAQNLEQGVELAKKAIDSGAAMASLEKMAEVSKS